MAGLPGSPASMLPAGMDEIPRQIKDLQRSMQELGPSVAKSFQSTIDSLTDLIGKQIAPAFNFASGDSYAIPAGQTNRVSCASFTMTVPPGYTQALISANAGDSAKNSTAGVDFLHSYIQISAPGQTTHFSFNPSATVPSGYYAESSTHMTTLYTGMAGGTVITIASQPYTSNAAWSSSPSTGTAIDATCMFLR